MNNLEDTGNITLAAQRETVLRLLEKRANARPPRPLVATTWACGVASLITLTLFAAHAGYARERPLVGVTLASHMAVLGVLSIVTAILATALVRIRLDIKRATQQDQIDTYRHERIKQQQREGTQTLLAAIRREGDLDAADTLRGAESFLSVVGGERNGSVRRRN
ncbi:hypothetical protein ABT336_27350 [Micromonospora sp. NPDC000207]|uniref:hypothetical protein n=1 Tax=Micromonospora sp. NPDC000207 TaxID=3154246 RepID=UPI0033306581